MALHRQPEGVEHAGIHLTDEGWVVRCPCGWNSNPKRDRNHAAMARGAHMLACKEAR